MDGLCKCKMRKRNKIFVCTYVGTLHTGFSPGFDFLNRMSTLWLNVMGQIVLREPEM